MFNLNFAKKELKCYQKGYNNYYGFKIHKSKTVKIRDIIPRERFCNFLFKLEMGWSGKKIHHQLFVLIGFLLCRSHTA